MKGDAYLYCSDFVSVHGLFFDYVHFHILLSTDCYVSEFVAASAASAVKAVVISALCGVVSCC